MSDAERDLLELARRWIWRAFDCDGYEMHDEFDTGECPGDDTCTWVRVVEFNRILKGWTQ